MKGDPKSWRIGSQSPEDKKREIMRRAKTQAETTHGIGGRAKAAHHAEKPVTLPKMPWDDEENSHPPAERTET